MGEHIPVMAEEAVAALAPRDDGLYVDATFGLGGYARAILSTARCRVLGLDRDAAAIQPAAALVQEAAGRFVFIHCNFDELDDTAEGANFSPADGVVMDLGVSSPQLDTPARGFSFREDGPLDMRMDRTGGGGDAGEIVNGWSEEELADIFREFGEERGARRAARAICAARPLTGTKALADVLAEALGPLYRDQPIHPATRCFQGLRIAVNDELGALGRGLAAAERLLGPGGRLAVVSFHSLEDRIVKRFMNARSGRAPGPSRHAPAAAPGPAPSFSLLFRGARAPSAEEVAANPRARSAKLRAAVRTDAPAWTAAA